MKREYDLSRLEWKLSGYTPYLWRFEKSMGTAIAPNPEISDISARVPGSVQASLRDAGIIPDWNVGLNSRSCEWVENRHWIYQARIPDDWVGNKAIFRLNCSGLDYSGCIFVNGQDVSPFKGSHLPHVFNITSYLKETDNILQIVFECPPRWLGCFGYTSKMTEWKPRFNYTWDWIPRLVQIGIWDSIMFVSTDGNEIQKCQCITDADVSTQTGMIEVRGSVIGDKASVMRISLKRESCIVRMGEFKISEFEKGIIWTDLSVDLWWPNMEGKQPLYTINCQLLDNRGDEIDKIVRRVGFKNVTWAQCEDAPDGADPWLCVVNGRPVFLQGVNWAPVRPNFADVTEEDYRKRLELYRDLGMNILRINGCGIIEKECFYNLCDELGIMVWQDFPLSCSGIDNWPPEDETSITEMAEIAKSAIERRRHHVSLIIWCGGNELQGALDGGKTGIGKPVDITHPLIKRLQDIVMAHDPKRRFLVTSPGGPRACASEDDFGKGLHWEVHGPWKAEGNLDEGWMRYWQNDDALFRSEVGAPGASSVDIIRKYVGNCSEFPVTSDNPYWSRPTNWWIECHQFVAENGHEPKDINEYVVWSQERQSRALAIAVSSCKKRFPRCGGVILWEGHDTFPMPTNTSIADFNGESKPAALTLAEIWRNKTI